MSKVIRFDVHLAAKEIVDGTKALGHPISEAEALEIAKDALEGKTNPITLLEGLLEVTEASEEAKQPILSKWAGFLEDASGYYSDNEDSEGDKV